MILSAKTGVATSFVFDSKRNIYFSDNVKKENNMICGVTEEMNNEQKTLRGVLCAAFNIPFQTGAVWAPVDIQSGDYLKIG